MHEPLASTDLNTASSVDAVWKIPTDEIGNAQGRRGMAPIRLQMLPDNAEEQIMRLDHTILQNILTSFLPLILRDEAPPDAPELPLN